MAARRSNLASEARGGGREEQPNIQGAVAALAQEGLEKRPLVFPILLFSCFLRVYICLFGIHWLKRLPPMQEAWLRSLGQEDPLEKEMAIHSSILAWRIPWTEEPGRLQSTGSQRVGHD